MSPEDAEARFAWLVAEMEGRDGVTLAPPGRGFGAGTLQVRGRIFAMVVRGELVLKLPPRRVVELVGQGAGRHFDAGRGRRMRQWLVIGAGHKGWRELAAEARDFVAAGG